jgi:large subunit ribosomal protein L18
MARLRTQKRRRKENKTDYKLRLNLLKSKIPRIVIRSSNKYFTIQLVESDTAQDKVILGTTSRDLIKQGLDKKFSGSLKSLPAGYLTGIAFAKKLDAKTEYIVDLGMTKTIKGNRIYAVLKGIIDGGAKIRASDSVFPSKERLAGEHLKDDAKKAFAKLKEKLLK